MSGERRSRYAPPEEVQVGQLLAGPDDGLYFVESIERVSGEERVRLRPYGTVELPADAVKERYRLVKGVS